MRVEESGRYGEVPGRDHKQSSMVLGWNLNFNLFAGEPSEGFQQGSGIDSLVLKQIVHRMHRNMHTVSLQVYGNRWDPQLPLRREGSRLRESGHQRGKELNLLSWTIWNFLRTQTLPTEK